MSKSVAKSANTKLLSFLFIYGVASLWHFVHNAVYLHEYPNLPSWLTAVGVYGAWCAITMVGIVGYWIYRRWSWFAGLLLIAIYALLGFGGLDHYVVAPVGAHSVMMNATILIEVVTAATLLAFVLRSLAAARRRTDGV